MPWYALHQVSEQLLHLDLEWTDMWPELTLGGVGSGADQSVWGSSTPAKGAGVFSVLLPQFRAELPASGGPHGMDNSCSTWLHGPPSLRKPWSPGRLPQFAIP